MKFNFRSYIKNHPLVFYFILTYLISWTIFILLALRKHGIIQLAIPYPIYYGAAYGPFFSAIIVTALIKGTKGLKELFGRMFRWRVHIVWWLVALSPLVLYLLASVIIYFIQGEWISLRLLGQVEFVPDLGIGALLLWLLTYGLGEETGWRGFALPRLQKNRSALQATFILWVFWALWHLPAFFLVYDPKIAFGFFIGVFAGAIVFTWLYNSSGGSLLMVIIWHGLFNFTTASKASKAGFLSALISTLVIVWAIMVVIWFKPASLSHRTKQIIE